MKKTELFSKEGYLLENYHYFHLRDTAGQEHDFHFHEFDKIVILLSGKVNYLVESETCALNPWDVLLIRHHTIHKALIERTEPYDRVILYLDRKYFERVMPGAGLMECFNMADQTGNYLVVPAEEQRKSLEEALHSYEEEAVDEKPGAQVMRDTCIMQLLVLINRICQNGIVRAETGEIQTDPKIAMALSYINENFTHDLSVDELAERVYLSRYYFMRLFKAQTGNTVYAYVRQKRLLYAAQLIREGMSAFRACVESGFRDYSAFHRAFKECFGISPGVLKKSGGSRV